ncbi:MAG: metallophosphoesterase [Oscillospiraceae bacterium]|nr:metallophosphoesterase [Oscillospiraceae bacterium]
MWVLIFGTVLTVAVISIFYLISRVRRFKPFQRLAEKHRLLSWLAAAGAVAAGAAAIYLTLGVYAVIIVMLHLMFIWMLCELVAFFIRKIAKKERRNCFEGIAALLLTAVWLGIGWYNAHHISINNYSFTTEKTLGGSPLRIVMFADSHLGITLDGDSFTKEMEKVQAQNPDLVVIAGDFVDDDTTKADMLRACEALGSLQTKYGVYFVCGNHDNGYYRYRDFDSQALHDALTENGVTVLSDETVLIDNRFWLIGRLDRSYDRAEAQALTADLDRTKYIIMLDHQPNDYQNEADAGADLVLSGHTHGGHLFPAGQIGLLLGMNDRIYGTEARGSCNFLVTSGISGWAIPFKTCTGSEICVIDIAGA